jgi:hypothetical protein
MNKYILEDKIRFQASNGEGAWTTVYLVDNNLEDKQFITCVLADKKLIEQNIKSFGWSQFYIDFKPAFLFEDENDPVYLRYGTDLKIKPIVIERRYRGLYPEETEISEEFRHYYNIYTNGYKEGTFLKIDEFGEEDDIIKFNPKHIQIKTEYLKKYAAAKKMDILIIFEYFREFKETFQESGINSNQIIGATDDQLNFQVDFQGNYGREDFHFNARLIGKKWLKSLVNYVPQALYDTIDKEGFEEFIIALDDSGNKIYKSCNAPYSEGYFLTPVFFKREVLREYYENPNKYEVNDRNIQKMGGWNLRLDNNHKEYVIVFLGDIGNDLPLNDQKHWKHFNISNAGNMSDSYYKNSIEGEFTNPELSEFIFKDNYEKLNNAFRMKFGFELFKELHSEDKFHFKTLRIPLINSVNEFDNQLLSLIKLIIDSINEKEICGLINDECKKLELDMKTLNPTMSPKGLDKLKLFLETKSFPSALEFIKYLKTIQKLRSESVAHRKGENYDKIKTNFGIGEYSYIDIFDDILIKLNTYFNELNDFFKFKSIFENDDSILDLDE